MSNKNNSLKNLKSFENKWFLNQIGLIQVAGIENFHELDNHDKL